MKADGPCRENCLLHCPCRVNLELVTLPTAISDTFSEVFLQLNEKVSSIQNLQGDTVRLSETDSGNYWTGSYPDTELITDKDRYPIGILNTPEIGENVVGFRRTEVTTEIDISVYSTRAEHPPKFVEKAVDALRGNAELQKEGFFKPKIVDTTENVLTTQRADLKIHEYTATVSMKFEGCVDA